MTELRPFSPLTIVRLERNSDTTEYARALGEFLDMENEEPRLRRAILPDEMARALVAADFLDRVNGRECPSPLVFVSLLIRAARVGAMLGLDVKDLDVTKKRYDLGPPVRNKRKGEAALDEKTFKEVVEYIGDRTEGPIFLSPRGHRLEEKNLLRSWREAFGLGLLFELWPASEPRDVEFMPLVNSTLITGKIAVSKGGNPGLLTADKLRERFEDAERVERLVDVLKETWEARMEGVDLHSLRKSHRTWGEACGVHPILLDKQLGHSTPGGGGAIDAARAILASATGRKHYVDKGIDMLDARRGADAVRGVLDQAMGRPAVANSASATA